MFTFGYTLRQVFEIIHVEIMFIWKAFGGLRSLPRYTLFCTTPRFPKSLQRKLVCAKSHNGQQNRSADLRTLLKKPQDDEILRNDVEVCAATVYDAKNSFSQQPRQSFQLTHACHWSPWEVNN